MTKIFLLLAVTAAAVSAQTDSLPGRLNVTAEPPGAVVFVDSVRAGTAPLGGLAVAPGRHVLRCAGRDSLAWPSAVAAETLVVLPGDTAVCHCVVPTVYHIVSDPPLVEIMLDDSVLAATPCFLTGRYKGKALTARAAGYEDALVVLPENGGAVTVRLHPSGSTPPPGPLITESQQRDLLPVYVSSGTAILSGVAAAYFKIKADTYYTDYQASGDPALLDKIHQYDTVSGVALVVSQVSLGALAYLLLFR